MRGAGGSERLSRFPPVPDSVTDGAIAELAQFMRGRTVLVLTGAGISTDSGIPDYRGPESIKLPRKPIWYREFLHDAAARKRYWSRSAIGWPKIHNARPNIAHRILVEMERDGTVSGIVTQNVDGLHQSAGNGKVLELHGSLDTVLCLQCLRSEAREHLQGRLLESNPGWDNQGAPLAPDGDAELPESLVESFMVPACLQCGGMLKPNVTFFGENVRKDRVEKALAMLDNAETLLVLGSSLAVYSGYRFPIRAAEQSKAVFIVNQGPTRADHLATVQIAGYLKDVLPRLKEAL